MAVLGNVIWLVLGGWWVAAFWAFWALVFVWAKRFREAFLQIAKFSLLPFGKEIIKEEELNGLGSVSDEEKKKIKLLNNIWLPFGIISAIYTLLSGLYLILVGLLCFIIIIFIPIGSLYLTAGTALLKMIPLILRPVGMKVVSKRKAFASATATEVERRLKAQNQ